MADRPNYFVLLDIDPDAPWSDGDFQTTLSACQASWTKKSKHPKYAQEYSQHLTRIGDIKRVMTDPTLRNVEAETARQEKAQKQKTGAKELDDDLATRGAKSFFTDEDIKNLTAKYAGIFDEAEIRNRIAKLGLPIKSGGEAGPKAPSVEKLDPTTFATIQTNLKALGKIDLYDFLGLTRNSRTSDLLERSNEIYTANMQVGDRSLPGITETSVLTGHTNTIFGNETNRGKYDNSVAEMEYDALAKEVVNQARDAGGTLYAGVRQKLLENAKSKGLDIKKADEVIQEAAKGAKMAVEVDTGTSQRVALLIVCPRCHELNNPTNQFCYNCKTPPTRLKIACPGCNKSLTTDLGSCPDCGFPIGNMVNVELMVSNAEALMSSHYYSDALSRLTGAQSQWTLTHKATPFPDDLTRSLNKLLIEARQLADEQSHSEQAFTQAMDDRNFYKARELLRQLQGVMGGSAFLAEAARISSAIQKAEDAVLQVKKSTTQGEAAVQLYQNILAECKDCPSALEALQKTPPAPPSELQLTRGAATVNLRWQGSPAIGVRYTIIRKAGSRPISASDGERLDTVSSIQFDDTSPEIGVPLFYSVYSDREGVLSSIPTEASNPIMLLGEVTKLTKQINSGSVHLSWVPPKHADQIIVTRSEQGKPSIRDHRLTLLDNTQVLDEGLQNGRIYYYGVYCVFLDPKGKPVDSNGVTIEAVPEEPPTYIETIGIEVVRTQPARTLLLKWKTPLKGQGAILMSKHVSGFYPMTVVAQEAIQSQGKLLTDSRGMVEVEVQDAGITYFTPVVLFQNAAYMGQPVEYTSLDDVTNLKVQDHNRILEIRWDFPKQCDAVIVAYSHHAYPAADDPAAMTARVTKAQYAVHGCHRIESPQAQDYYIVVYATINQNGQELRAPGIIEGSRYRLSRSSKVVISYEAGRRRKLLGKGALFLNIIVKGQGYLPDLLLVRKQGTLPVNKSDGEVIMTLPGINLNSPQVTLEHELSENMARPNGYVRLFLQDDSLYDIRGGYIRIEGSPKEKAQVF